MTSLFIMSSERSGSNLVRSILGAHSAVAAPPPPHFWVHFALRCRYYGPLDETGRFEKLAKDLVALTDVEGSHLRWKHHIDVQEVIARAQPHNLTGAILALYDMYAECDGKSGWVSKENNIFDVAFRVRAQRPDAKFIYLCRDGRDVACSMKKVPTHDQHVYHIAHEWRSEQERCLSVYQDLAAIGAARIVRYEDLLTNPEAVTRDICAFAGLPFEPAMLNFHNAQQTKQEASATGYWKNLDKPLMASNQGKYRTELSKRELAIFESVAREPLLMLGYSLDTTADRRIGRLERRIFAIENFVQMRGQHERLMAEPGRVERAALIRSLRPGRGAKPPTYVHPRSAE